MDHEGREPDESPGDPTLLRATLGDLDLPADRLARELADYRLLVAHSNDLLVKVDLRGRLLFVSPSYCDLFGRSEEALLGHTFIPPVHEEDRSATARAMQRLFEPPHQVYFEHRAMTRHGWRWLAWSDRGLLDADGKVEAIVGVGRDVTRQKQAELAMRESELRFRQLFEHMSDGVAVYGVEGEGDDFVFIDVNRAAESILRIDRERLRGRRVSDMFPGVASTGLLQVFRDVWRSGESVYHPLTHYVEKRLDLWVDNHVLKLPNGELVAIFEDLSAQKRTEQRLGESERRLRESQAYAHVGFWELSSDQHEALWSDEIYRILGLPADAAPGPETLREIVHPDDLQGVLASLQNSLQTGLEHRMEYRVVRPDGQVRWVDCRAHGAGSSDDGRPARLVGFVQDITERKVAELALQRSEERFELAMQGANDGLFDWDLVADTIYYSPRWKSMLGYADSDLPNHVGVWRELIDPQQREQAWNLLNAYRSGKREHFEIEYRLRHREGHSVDVLARATVFKDGQGRPVRMVGTHVDISARKQAESEIQHLAFHDSLTGLPNRLLFNETLDQELANFRRDGKAFALHLLDLDHFKEINDNLGHPVGDQLLQAVAERISAMLRASDLLARLGGDEFALIQQDVQDPGESSALAAKIIGAMDDVFSLADCTVHTSVSVGIVIPAERGVDSARLMSYADVAMYKAKEAGRGTYAFFEDSMTRQLQHEMALCDQLRAAIDNGQLEMHYQPQLDLSSGRLVGVEALVRWRHPQRGMLLPVEFLPMAERRGLIRRVANFALEAGCRQMRAWEECGVDVPYVAINLCATQINAPDFHDQVVAVVQRVGVEPARIAFEFTETTLIDSSDAVREAIRRLAKRGFRFAIDDFGTGFASLNYLREFHADMLKVCPDFIRDIVTDQNDAAIVRAIVDLGRSLGLRTIAEGVENSEQVALLQGFGCHSAQGFHFAAAVPAEEVADLFPG